jgi:uncharacterized protein YbjT (DUF2867 family)
MKAVLIGSTGLVGQHLLERLLEEDKFEAVIVVSRKPLIKTHPKLKVVLIKTLEDIKDLSDELLGSHYFCCLGTTIKVAGSQENFRKVDYEAVLNFAEIAKKNKAEKFVFITSKGANSHSQNFYIKVKGEIEEAVKALDIASISIFRPGLLMGQRQEKRFLEKLSIQAASLLQILIPEKLMSKAVTSVEVLAKKMVQESFNTDSRLRMIESEAITHLK